MARHPSETLWATGTTVSMRERLDLQALLIVAYLVSLDAGFTNPEAAGKNRIAPPAKVLHFFNAPHSMTEYADNVVFRHRVRCVKESHCASSQGPAFL